MNEKVANISACLRDLGYTNKCLRFCTRIAVEAFDENIFPDLPLTAYYPSSAFHARFALEGVSYKPGRLVDGELLDDHFIEIFFDSRWHQKSPRFGQALRTRMIKGGAADRLLIG